MDSEGENPTGIPPKILPSGRYYFFARGNSGYRLVAGSMGLDRDLTISDQRITPCLPAGRYKVFSGIPVEFRGVSVCNLEIRVRAHSSFGETGLENG